MFEKIRKSLNSFKKQQPNFQVDAAADAQIVKSAQDLFDNRLGWSDNRNPYAPREFWRNLSTALYGKDDPRTQELLRENKD